MNRFKLVNTGKDQFKLQRSIEQLDAEMEEIKGKVNSTALKIPGHWINYDDTNGQDQEIRWMSGSLIMANIEVSQGGIHTTFRVHEFAFDPDDKRTRKKQRLVTRSFSEAFLVVKELLS